MKRFIPIIAAAVGISAAGGIGVYVCHAENPIAQTVYTSDPAPMVYNNTCYVYTGHDADNSTYFTMPDWQCYSSTDMKNWTNYGTILSGEDFSWAEKDSAWAAQCIERNGKFYMYVTLVPAATGGRAIGVAVADSPTGPFKDALGKPLCGPNWDYIDPTVFIDDDGQAYLYFGNPQPYYVKLNEDMISYSGQINKVNLTTQGFGTRPDGDDRHQTLYEEGPWFYKRGSLYYLMYAASGIPENICYSTSSGPEGPWTYKGEIMPSGGNSFTNHSGICDYKGKSYFFYHNGLLPGGGGFDRSVAVEEFTYASDGSIPKISRSTDGPKQISYLNPYKKTQAETMSWESGIETEKCSSGGIDIANIENGDYVKISGVDFSTGADSFTISAASNTSGGAVELHLDSLTGKVIGKCDITGTGGWQSWKTFKTAVSGASGAHDLYLKFTGSSGFLFNADWWQFGGVSSSDPGSDVPVGPVVTDPASDGYMFHSTFESSKESWSGRGAATVGTSTKAAYKGTGSLFVSGRTATWNGASLALSETQFVPGKTYSFSADVMQNTQASETFFMKLQYVDSNGDTNYSQVAQGSSMSGSWVQLKNTSYTIPADASEMNLYIETESSDTDFYVDEAIGAKEGTAVEGPAEKILTKGDINYDGSVDILDVCLGRNRILEGFTDQNEKLAADTDKNGKAEVVDIQLLQKFVMGLIDEFPVPDNIWDTYQETATPQMQKFYADSIYQMGNTSRLWDKVAKAQSGKDVTVAYLGGSITEGGGLDTCYAKRSYNYFKDTFGTGNNVKYINAGLSGTSSVVGLMRAQNDILYAQPDVIFLEFSVNDHPEDIYKKSYESLVKQCLSQPNDPAVIILINRAKGGYSMQTQMAAIGKNYNVPVISMDNALTNAFNSGLLKTEDYYTDEYHPHSDGCKLISDCISYFYRQALKTENASDTYVIPSTTVYGSEYSTATMAALSDLKNLNTGSFKTDNSYNRFKYGFTFQKNSNNTPMTFSTEGKGIFIVFKSNQNSSLGTLNVTVNGKKSQINGNKLYAWGGPDADLAYIQNTSGTLDVSINMDNASSDFTIWGIGVIK